LIVSIDKKAIKDLSKIDKKEVEKILLKIENLEDYPDVPNLKKLTKFDPPFRLRVGDYRVLFDVDNDTITVYRIKHRKESYK
jgi:mRNA interferase RelE/StbE